MLLRRAALVLLVALGSVASIACSGVAASVDDGPEATEGPSSAGASSATTAVTATAPGPYLDAGANDPADAASSDATTGTTSRPTLPTDGGSDASRDASPDAAADAAPPPPTCTHPLPDPATAPATVDLGCFTSTFADDFTRYDISSGPVADGKNDDERWFNGVDECCMDPSNGWPGVMYPTPSQTTQQAVNPYSLLPGGGLQISLTQQNDEWFSGVMTTVDANDNGFAQAYGYFEMTTKLPAGTGTWPSFWMLSLPRNAPGGEIDIFEQLGCSPPLNPAVEKIFHFTLHDWKGGTTPLAYTAQDLPDLTADFHRYGLLWNRTYMALYFDGALLTTTPTPAVMIDMKYFLLADLGIGAGWDTTQTPSPSNLLIKSINAYTVPGF